MNPDDPVVVDVGEGSRQARRGTEDLRVDHPAGAQTRPGVMAGTCPDVLGENCDPPKEPDEAARKKTIGRKRTKTGCITCRKRRIKCGEERPICRNCIKSKRTCDGYSQRVVFKHPIGAFHGGHYGPMVYPPDGLGDMGSQTIPGQSRSAHSPLQAIAPKPPAPGFHAHAHAQLPHEFLFGTHLSHLPPLPTGYSYSAAILSADLASSSSSSSPALPPGIDSFSFLQPPPQPHPRPPSHPRPPLYPEPEDDFFVRSAHFLRELPGGVIPTPSIQSRLHSALNAYDDIEFDDEVEIVDASDDESMEESDQETPVSPSLHMFNEIVNHHRDGPYYGPATKMRSFSAYAQHGVLATYSPSAANTPLNDPLTAAVFAHFVSVTGPSMSLYERHPFDASLLFQADRARERLPSSWTYTFPVIAFSHPALMQAILALGSLQIATLQRAPATPAIKHYHLAIRRIARNLRSCNRRTRPATLAATLLLAYFEVWSSDHSKWCNHLYGARQLFREIDLRGMTRELLPLKRWRQRQRQQARQQASSQFGIYAPESFNALGMEDEAILDLDLVGRLSGYVPTPADYGQDEDNADYYDGRNYARADRDIEDYEHLRDLFWWYAKMDIYQSILGGTKLFMEYKHWNQCPPRANIGKSDMIYGTYDHLMLLLGRLANYASRDLPRKTKVFKHQGPPGTSPPMFPGILPPKGKVSAPMGFSPPREPSPSSDQSEDIDVETATSAAIQQWGLIKEAFEVFRSRLGPLFQPLAPEYADNRDSPFGRTLQYRTFSIAGIWMNYYMGIIHLHRTHPSMPPVALMAAGQAAKSTALFANEIGRIAAGLSDDCSSVTEVSTIVGAAFIESCFCMFVAAVQYYDISQRHWMVRRMHDIARLTGWQSARQIAEGCESGWIKAYQVGGGPHYVRLELQDEPSSIWANPRRIDHIIGNATDNRLALVRSERAHYALGLLSVEHDLEKLDLKEEPI